MWPPQIVQGVKGSKWETEDEIVCPLSYMRPLYMMVNEVWLFPIFPMFPILDQIAETSCHLHLCMSKMLYFTIIVSNDTSPQNNLSYSKLHPVVLILLFYSWVWFKISRVFPSKVNVVAKSLNLRFKNFWNITMLLLGVIQTWDISYSW